MRMSIVNAAIVGLGRWGQRLVDSVQTAGTPKGTKIVFTRAVVRGSPSTRAFAAEQKLAVSATIEEALRDSSIEALVLATPHDTHASQILIGCDAGRHIFVEKPLALCYSEAEAALSAARKRGLVIAVGFNRRFLPAMRSLKEIVADPSFGAPVHIEGNFSNNSGLSYREGMWRVAESGAKSSMTAMGVHILDSFIHLFGPVRTVRTTSSRVAIPVNVDDIVCVTLKFVNGASGFLSTSLVTPRHWRLQAFGTSKWVHMRDESLLEVASGIGPAKASDFEEVDSVRLELEAFAESIIANVCFPVPPHEALHGVAVLEAIFESARVGGSEVVVQSAVSGY